jgi:hypothetical protein
MSAGCNRRLLAVDPVRCAEARETCELSAATPERMTCSTRRTERVFIAFHGDHSTSMTPPSGRRAEGRDVFAPQADCPRIDDRSRLPGATGMRRASHEISWRPMRTRLTRPSRAARAERLPHRGAVRRAECPPTAGRGRVALRSESTQMPRRKAPPPTRPHLRNRRARPRQTRRAKTIPFFVELRRGSERRFETSGTSTTSWEWAGWPRSTRRLIEMARAPR